jgi:hypothetical protein
MTKVVNFLSGPSAGKTTMSAKLFAIMKEARRNVEYVPEFAKEIVWQERQCIEDQLYLLGEQHHRLWSLLGKVDYIITDGPLILMAHYIDLAPNKYKTSDVNFQKFKDSAKQFIYNTFDMFENYNFFVDRGNRKFIQQGRIQNEIQSKEIDGHIRFLLKEQGYAFTTITHVNDVLSMLNRSEDEQFSLV